MANLIPIATQQAIIAQSRRFLQWWWSELAALVPGALKRLFAPEKPIFSFTVTDSEVTVSHGTSGNMQRLGAVELHAESSRQLSTIIASLVSDDKSCTVHVYVDHHRLLSRTLELPLAVESDLQNVLAYEIDRLMPFEKTSTWYAFKSGDRNTVDGKLAVHLWAGDNRDLQPVIDFIEQLGLHPTMLLPIDALASESFGSTPASLNLLPPVLQQKPKPVFSKISRALAIIAVVLLALVIVFPVSVKKREIARLESAIAAIESPARRIAQQRAQLISALDTHQVLIDRKQTEISKTLLLTALTRRIPDNTWINRLAIDGAKLKLDGESARASDLIELLDALPILQNVEFAAPITKNIRTAKEKFQIRAVVVGSPQSFAAVMQDDDGAAID